MSNRWSAQELVQAVADGRIRLSRQNRPQTGRNLEQGKATDGQSAPARTAVAPQSTLLPPLSFTVLGSPVPKPRQSRRDKWAKRPCVLRYRTWADEARNARHAAKRAAFPNIRFDGEIQHGRIKAIAFFKMPSIWSATTKAKMRGQPHCLRPDADNLLKAIGDALYPTGDEHLYDLQITKRWEDGNGPRTVITLW